SNSTFKFCKCYPDYEIPSRNTVTNSLLPSVYNSTLELFKNQITKAITVTLTKDGWAKCAPSEGNHTGENIADWLRQVIKKFGIEEKVTSTVTDNASYMEFAITNLHIAHVQCFAHSLNIIVQQSIQSSIQSIYSNNPFRKKIWNSTFANLERFLKNKEPILSSLEILNIKSKVEGKDWNIMKQALKNLVFFKAATIDVSTLKQGLEVKLDYVNSNNILKQAILLDPTYKEEGFIDDCDAYKKTYDSIVKETMFIIVNNSPIAGNVTDIEEEKGDSDKETDAVDVLYNILEAKRRHYN
uniref:DUF659 domain-containing protein n=1 Tax=Anopheles minimus TaxID=112268 RepID=A0A182WA92_9DIPT